MVRNDQHVRDAVMRTAQAGENRVPHFSRNLPENGAYMNEGSSSSTLDDGLLAVNQLPSGIALHPDPHRLIGITARSRLLLVTHHRGVLKHPYLHGSRNHRPNIGDRRPLGLLLNNRYA